MICGWSSVGGYGNHGCLMSFAHPWKIMVESSRVHLSQVLAWGFCLLNIIMALWPGTQLSLLAEAWESGVTFQGNKC